MDDKMETAETENLAKKEKRIRRKKKQNPDNPEPVKEIKRRKITGTVQKHGKGTEAAEESETELSHCVVEANIRSLPPEILEMVFKMLDYKSLKSTRLVCESWNIQLLPLFRDKSTLNLASFFEDVKDIKNTRKRENKINRIIISNISMKFKSYRVQQSESEYSNQKNISVREQWEQLMTFCEKYGSHVKSISAESCSNIGKNPWTIGHPDILELLSEIINHSCSNLEHLDLHDLPTRTLTRLTGRSKKFKNKLCLKSISISVNRHFRIEKKFSKYLEEVIGASENFEHFSNDRYGFYPNLSQNKRIKSLLLEGKSHEITRMMRQASSSLESLDVSFEKHSRDRRRQVQVDHKLEKALVFPRLTKLTLRVTSRFVFSLEFLGQLLPKCPALQTLEVLNYEDNGPTNKEQILDDLGKVLKEYHGLNLTTLSIEDIGKDTKILESLLHFPKLSSLKFTAYQRSKDKSPIVQAAIETCSKMKLLQHLKMSITSIPSDRVPYGFAELASYFLPSPGLIEGLKSLQIVNMDTPDFRDDLSAYSQHWTTVEKFLLLTRNCLQAELFGFSMEFQTALQLYDIIKRHSLPVQFLGRDSAKRIPKQR